VRVGRNRGPGEPGNLPLLFFRCAFSCLQQFNVVHSSTVQRNYLFIFDDKLRAHTIRSYHIFQFQEFRVPLIRNAMGKKKAIPQGKAGKKSAEIKKSDEDWDSILDAEIKKNEAESKEAEIKEAAAKAAAEEEEAEINKVRTLSHNIASHHITSHHIPPHHTTPHHTTPHHTTSHHTTTPHHTTSHQPAIISTPHQPATSAYIRVPRSRAGNILLSRVPRSRSRISGAEERHRVQRDLLRTDEEI
jgi:hypothetical protein